VRTAAWALTAALALAGCGGGAGGTGGAPSPEEAVTRFLEPWSQDQKKLSRDKERVLGFWERACDWVDPRLRPKLRFKEDAGENERANCGALVVLHVQYTGDTGEMAAPTRIAGTPVDTETTGDESVVTVAMRYSADPDNSAPAPPAEARIRVLVVRRDDRWYIATPRAFNPLETRDGGMTADELRAEHRRLLEG
jgi:hypothetical protein